MTETVAKNRKPTPSADVTPAMFHILLALAEGPRHGYAIMQEVERSTHGEMRLPPGTLYRSIKRLLDDGLIEESGGPDDDDTDERRRYYELTADGRGVAVGEARRLAEIVGLARAKNLLDGHERV
ncbi:MAG: PadR family transcriptional regulator [Acidobacteriota bacterium]|jgi:DNA-binding PadR family transcriptional regulator